MLRILLMIFWAVAITFIVLALIVAGIVYIGETTKQTLISRLWQFSQSAFSRKIGHSGGWTYSKIFLDEQPIDEAPVDLYVSVLSVDRDEIESRAYIKHIERLLIWEYFKVKGTYPTCNTA